MATLATQSYSAVLSNWAAAVQGACSILLDFTVGSVLRAVGQAQAGVVLWLQGLILQLLATTRLATSTGLDVDSFVADFGMARLPAIAATGQVTFARFTPTNQAVVSAGTLLQTADGTQTFQVIADTTQSAWSPAQNGYVIPANTSSVTATVQNIVGGTGGNISAGALTVIQTGISGVDTVTNASAFTNGVNAETDAALRTRFLSYLSSLSRATEGAIGNAITSLNQNLQYTLVEQPLGTPQVVITVDDGSGSIPTPLVNAVSAAVNAVRAAGILVGVNAAIKETANVNMTIVTASGYVHATVVGQVATAITNFINNVGLGNTVSYMQIAAVAFGVAGVVDVTNYTLNSGTSDLVPTASKTYKSGTISVS